MLKHFTTLTDEFVKTDIENYTIAYDSKNVAVFALKEAFALADGFQDYTLEQYGDLVLQNNNLSSSKISSPAARTMSAISLLDLRGSDAQI